MAIGKGAGKKNDGDWHVVWQAVQMDRSKKRKLIYKQLNHGLRPMTADEAANIPNLWSLHRHSDGDCTFVGGTCM